jgi:hypothetical protein
VYSGIAHLGMQLDFDMMTCESAVTQSAHLHGRTRWVRARGSDSKGG